jgi:hypothetical protein
LDVGHELLNLRVAAASLGWSIYVLQGPNKAHEKLLGLDRREDFPERKEEHEALDILLLVIPNSVTKIYGSSFKFLESGFTDFQD